MHSSGSLSRRRGWRVTLAVSGALVMGVLIAGALPVAAANTHYNTNLVKNPGAENAANGWVSFPDATFQSKAYGPGGLGFPSKATGRAINGGSHFFYAGYDSIYGCGDGQQEITLTGIGNAIDTGHVRVQFSGYGGTNGAADINAHMDLQFFNSQHHTDNISNWGIKRQASSTNEQYLALKGSKLLPKHTRIVQVHLWADGDGTQNTGDCQAFWDNISVVLKSV